MALLFRFASHSSPFPRPPRPRHYSSLPIAHSSWFKLEDQGMKDFELLARGSAFYVQGPTTGTTIALVSAHVAAPHRFRNYFPQEWLRHVRDSDCRSILELRSHDGTQITRAITTQSLVKGFRHANLDLAAFLLTEEQMETQLTSTADNKIPVLSLPPEENPAKVGDSLTIAGFRLIGESGSGTEAVVPTELNGSISEIWNARVFVDTGDTQTEMGMCGGPAVLADDRTVCVGILEGLVPELNSDAQNGEQTEIHKRLQKKSVLVGAQELRRFLHDVETEAANIKASG